ncbi:MAG: hypothetical protein WKG07_01350 [Hymenobacter sp.]
MALTPGSLCPGSSCPNLPLLNARLPNSDFQPRTTFGAGCQVRDAHGLLQLPLTYNFNYGYSLENQDHQRAGNPAD